MFTDRKWRSVALVTLCIGICGSYSVAFADAASDKSKQVRLEVKQLEQLPLGSLEQKAKTGDSLASLALANRFSSESQSLVALPVLANSAAEDAARWYSLAAQMGALQSRPLAAVSVKPLRAARYKKR